MSNNRKADSATAANAPTARIEHDPWKEEANSWWTDGDAELRNRRI